MIIFAKILLVITLALVLGFMYNVLKGVTEQAKRDSLIAQLSFFPYLVFLSLFVLGVR